MKTKTTRSKTSRGRKKSSRSRSKSWFGERGLIGLLSPVKLRFSRTAIFAGGTALVGVVVVTLAFAATSSAGKTGLLASNLTNPAGTAMCLADYNNLTTNSNPIVVQPCNAKTADQQWAPYSDGTIRIHAKCLDVKGNKTAGGTRLDLYTCQGHSNQDWTHAVIAGTSSKELVSASSGKCLDIMSAATANNSPVQIWGCNHQAQQIWKWEPISTTTASPTPVPSSVPSNSPNPTATPKPTSTPKPTATPNPTSTPSPVNGSTQSLNCAPAASATMTNTVSSKCGFPDTTNTGAVGSLTAISGTVSAPSASNGHGWTASGDTITVGTSGALVENISTGDVIDVSATNVTIKNVKIIAAATGTPGISLRGANNVLVENSTIAGTNATSGRMFVAVKDIESGSTYSANADIKANNIYYVSTGVQIDHGTIEDNYIHDLGMISGDHLNGTTSNGGGDNVLLTIQHNTSFNPQSQTDAISLFEDFAVQQNRVINDNLVAGGGYSIYGGQNAGGSAIANIRITNNHFSRMYFANGGYWGPAAAFTTGGIGNVWSGNVWDDTGAAVPGP